jgi:hypothetical protein
LDNQKIVIIVLASIILIIVNLYLLDQLSGSWQDSIIVTEQQGYEQGAQDTAKAIFESLDGCQVATVTVENRTKTFIETNCISNLEP